MWFAPIAWSRSTQPYCPAGFTLTTIVGLPPIGRTCLTSIAGENISPAEVEAVLEAHPQVLEAAVVGRPDRDWGEAVTAIVVARAGAHLGEDELRTHCVGVLAPYKVPKRVLLTTGPLPHTPSGKLLRRELR